MAAQKGGRSIVDSFIAFMFTFAIEQLKRECFWGSAFSGIASPIEKQAARLVFSQNPLLSEKLGKT